MQYEPNCNQFAKEDVRRGEKIGQGSFWKVYKATLMDGIPCAVKRLKVIDEDQGTLKKKVIEECRTWSGLNNPFIVKIHGIYYDGKGIALGVPSLILELLDKSLSNHLQSTARDRINLFPIQSKVSILQQVAKGLEYLHNEKCVVHGDLTPNNVLLKEESPGCFTAKLTDFGMSRVVEGCDAEMSTGYGAYVYMPPESHDAAQVKTTAMDIYSYGVLGVYTLTHKSPRPSYASRMDESGHLVGVTEFSRYSHLLLKLTEDEQQLVPVLEACIQYNPKDRTNAFILIERIAVISAQLKLAGNVKLGSATASSHSVHSHQIFNGCTFDKCDLNFRSEVPASLLQHSECSPISHKRDFNGTVEETVLTMNSDLSLRSEKDGIHPNAGIEKKLAKDLRCLHWEELDTEMEIPNLDQPTAVYFKQKVYVGNQYWPYTSSLLVYDVATNEWLEQSFYRNRDMCGFSMSVCGNKLHVICGHWRDRRKEERCSDTVFSILDDEAGEAKWHQTLPPLLQGRVFATSTVFGNFVLVAGGLGCNGQLFSTIEIIDTSEPFPVWKKIHSLPVKSYLLQSTVTNESVFIGLGIGAARTLYTVTLPEIKSLVNKDQPARTGACEFWKPLPDDNPLEYSGLTTVKNCLVTVGGRDPGEEGPCQPYLHLYDCSQKKWLRVSRLFRARSSPAMYCVKSKDDLYINVFVFCGWGATKSVETCKLIV